MLLRIRSDIFTFLLVQELYTKNLENKITLRKYKSNYVKVYLQMLKLTRKHK